MGEVRSEAGLRGYFGTKLNSAGEEIEDISKLGNWMGKARSQTRQAV